MGVLAMVALMNLAGVIKSGLFLLLPLAGSVLVAFGLFQVVMDLRRTNQKRMMERLKERAGSASRREKAKDGKGAAGRRRLRPLEAVGVERILGQLSFVPRLQKVLDQANVDWSASRLLLNLAAVSAASFCGLLLLKVGVLVGVGVGCSVMVLPILWLIVRRKKRMSRLLGQLPDVFELISQALRAGHSLASGIHLVSQQMPDPAGTEFARVFHEQNLGIKIEEALLNMAKRVDQMDVRFFVTAVLIQRQTGGDLAEVLDKIGWVIRDRINLFGQVKALTAEGRLSGWTLLALPVLVFFVEMGVNPTYASVLLYDRTGRLMLVIAVIMQLMGMAMIRKIVNIKV